MIKFLDFSQFSEKSSHRIYILFLIYIYFSIHIFILNFKQAEISDV